MTVKESGTYKRLSALTEKLGLKPNEAGALNGELLGYSAGIELVKSFFDMVLREINVEKSTGIGLDIYAGICNINKNLSPEEKRSEIIKRLSECFGSYSVKDFEKELRKISPDIFYTSAQYNVIIHSVTSESIDRLKILGDAIEGYIAPYVKVSLDGEGCTFDYWDSTPFAFGDFENINCPFSVLDTIKQTN